MCLRHWAEYGGYGGEQKGSLIGAYRVAGEQTVIIIILIALVNVLRVHKWWDGSMNLRPNYGGLERLFREGRDLGWGCTGRRDWPLCHICFLKLSCSPLHTVIRKKSILEAVPAPPPRTSFRESESHLQGCSVTGQSLLLLRGALLLLLTELAS